MRKTLLLIGLAGSLAAPASQAFAQPPPIFPGSCWGHRVAGTVIGGGGGALIATAIAAGVAVTPWAWAGAGIGALLGHAIGVHSCRNHWRQAYYDSRWRDAYNEGYAHGRRDAPQPAAAVYAPEHSYYAERYDYYRPAYHPHHYKHHHAEYAYARAPRG